MEVEGLRRGTRGSDGGLHTSETHSCGLADGYDETRVVEVVTVSTEPKHNAVARLHHARSLQHCSSKEIPCWVVVSSHVWDDIWPSRNICKRRQGHSVDLILAGQESLRSSQAVLVTLGCEVHDISVWVYDRRGGDSDHVGNVTTFSICRGEWCIKNTAVQDLAGDAVKHTDHVLVRNSDDKLIASSWGCPDKRLRMVLLVLVPAHAPVHGQARQVRRIEVMGWQITRLWRILHNRVSPEFDNPRGQP